VAEKILLPEGVPAERIEYVSPLPVLGRFFRFHGLLSNWRYRHLKENAALIIHPEYRTVVDARIPQVVLFYDLIFLDAPSKGGEPKLSRRALFLYKAWRASRVRWKISITEATKKAILAKFPGTSPESITPLHLGIRNKLASPEKETRVPKDSGPALLYVGGADPRKNLPALLRNLSSVIGSLDTAHLHIAGCLLPREEREMRAIIEVENLSDRVTMHGLVSDDELVALYRDADFFLFPSLLEGFGLPLIEAMHQGVVCCAFKNSSIPEVVGDAAILTEDNDFRGWGEMIERLWADRLAFDSLRHKARKRASLFTEEKMFERYGEYLAGLIGSMREKQGMA
jgi:glycosyltransferase involved in cell wall biosynthesis